MKCANLRFAFAVLAAFCAIFGMVAPALAQAPATMPATATPPVASAPSGVTDVAPLNVPSAPPLLADTAAEDDDMAGLGTDEGEEETPSLVRDIRRTPTMGTMASGARAGASTVGSNMPSAVTDVVNDLKRAEKSISLEDVARAQDALARLDLLLELERKINEIEKTREDRKNIGKSLSREGSSMGRVPASALSLPISGNSGGMRAPSAGVYRPSVPSAPSPSMPVSTASKDSYKVDQISGSNGRYRAVLVDSGGKKTTVSEGEKLNGHTVKKISATGVTLADGSTSKVLTVESGGVPMVVRN